MNDEVKILNEELLLIELCRLEFSDNQISKIRSVAASVKDWQYFSSLANAHGVAALIYHNLDKNNLLNGIPEEIIAYLRGTLMRSLGRNAFNTESIVRVLRLFNKENIRTVLLKGLALELSVYGNEGLRQMSDVDILLNKEDCLKARELLIRDGYVSLPVKSFLHEIIITNIGKHLPSLLKNGTSVEIHHELFGIKNNVLTRILFDNSYQVELKGEKVYIPPPQIFFLYLIKHLFRHEMNNESQLRLYTDLVALIEKYYDEIFNETLLEYASQSGMSEILASHLKPLHDFWGIDFPGWLNEYINIWHNSDSEKKFIFFLKSPGNNPPLDKPRFYRHILGEIPGVHRKFLYLMGDLFPSIAFMKNRYKCASKWKAILYYPHRIGKIIWLFR